MDEYKDYEKALEALNEANRCVAKAKGQDNEGAEERRNSIKKKIQQVENFLRIRR